MPQPFDVIILGLGAMGSAAAAHLALRGAKILGLDQFDIPNALGSSHGQSRLIRLAYYEHPDYVPLLRRAYQLWPKLEQHTTQKLLHITGGVYLAHPDHELITGSLQSARQHNLPHELLTPKTLRARYPQFHLPKNHIAFYEPTAGFLLPEKCVAAHILLALNHGAELHAHEPALDWSASPNSSITVRTAHHTYRARHLIITAGPWTARALPFLKPRLRITRQTMHWFWPRHPEKFTLGTFPCWCAASPAGGLVYGAPMVPDQIAPLGLKLAHHFPGQTTDPDAIIRTPLPGDADVPRATLASLLPDAAGPLLTQRVCLYSNSPDQHFILDRHPRHKNITLAAGFSGHGFKFSAVIGEILADLALTGKTAHPIRFLGLQRFKARAERPARPAPR